MLAHPAYNIRDVLWRRGCYFTLFKSRRGETGEVCMQGGHASGQRSSHRRWAPHFSQCNTNKDLLVRFNASSEWPRKNFSLSYHSFIVSTKFLRLRVTVHVLALASFAFIRDNAFALHYSGKILYRQTWALKVEWTRLLLTDGCGPHSSCPHLPHPPSTNSQWAPIKAGFYQQTDCNI